MIMDRLDQAEVDLSRCKEWSHVLTMRIADLEASRKASERAIAESIQEKQGKPSPAQAPQSEFEACEK